MNARENLAELSDFLAGDLTLELAAVARPRESQGAPEYRSIALARQAEQFFRDVVNDCVGRHLSPLSWSVREIDPTYKPDQTDVEWQRLVDLLPVSSTITRLSNLSSTEPFRSKDDDYKSRLSYWAAVMSDADGRQAFFFRAFSAKAELKRKRGAALVARDGAFGLVEDSIFVFDDVVDCFVFGEFVYVLRRRDFRRIFDQM